MIYRIKPQLVKKPWGITQLERFTGIKPPDNEKYGEIWVASALNTPLKEGQDGCRPNETFDGINLYDLIDSNKDFLGNIDIDTRRDGPSGKTESWYFREVIGNVKIITGLKISKEEFIALIEEGYFEEDHPIGDMEDILDMLDVKSGDAFILNPGTIHTIYPQDKNSFAIIDEVQQGFGDNNLPTISKILMVNNLLSLQVHPSDDQVQNVTDPVLKQQLLAEPTLRIYDFGRGRKSHTKISAQFINFDGDTCIKVTPKETNIFRDDMGKILNIFSTKYFSKDIIELNGLCLKENEAKQNEIMLKHDKKYYVYNIMDGEVQIDGINMIKGDIFVVDAKTSQLSLKPIKKSRILRDYV